MKLKRLRTHAWRSIQDTELEFGDVMTVLAGQQGAGKSSHLHAICAVLTGRTPHTDRRGAGIKEQIRRDQSRAEIELTCQFASTQPDSVIKRTIAESGQQIEVPFGGKNLGAKQALLTERLGGVDEVPDVLLDPRLFADRDEKEQTNALLKLLRPPTIVVPEAAKAVGIQSLASIQQVDDQIKSIKDGSIRSLNAVIKNLEETCPAEPTPDELTAAHEAENALAQLDARIQSLALEVRNAEFLLEDARKHAAEVEQARALVEELPGLRIRLGVLEADEAQARDWSTRMSRLQEDLAGAAAVELKVSTAKQTAERLPGLREALANAKSQLQLAAESYRLAAAKAEETKSNVDVSAKHLESLRETLTGIEAIGSQCPTCSRKLTEKAKSEIVGSLKKEVELEEGYWRSYVARAEAAAKERSEKFEAGQAARKKVDRLTQEVAQAEYLASDINLKTSDPAKLQSELDMLKGGIDGLTKKYPLDVLPLASEIRLQRDKVFSAIAEAERAEKLIAAPAPNVADLERSSADLAEALSGAQEILPRYKQTAELARDTLRRADEYATTASRLSAERTKRERYNMAVESLLALKDSILGGEAAKKLQFDCTAIFQEFFPQAHVILDPSGASVAPLGSQEGTPVAHISSGQKVIFDMGLRIAAAKATGFNLLAMDDANKLAPRGREAMLKTLMASGCQVIMCTTADGVGKIPGAVVYQVSSPGVWGPTSVQRIS
jgi:DNA repair exonuclease SbcCD ATPase subunit